MKLLAFAASNSSNSINRLLVNSAVDLMRTGLTPEAEIDTLDLHDFEMPIYSPDRQAESGIPAPATEFLRRIAAADALLISFPVHNGYYPAAYKNLFDWASRAERNVYQGKPMVIMSATPGPRGGADVLEVVAASARRQGSDVRGMFSIGSFGETFDRERMRPAAEDKLDELRQVLSTLAPETA